MTVGSDGRASASPDVGPSDPALSDHDFSKPGSAERAAPPRHTGSADWRNDAACRAQDPELFFPIGTTGPAIAQLQQAKAVCGTCPVQAPCLQWALQNEPIGQENGVYAGLSEAERRAVKRRLTRSRHQPEAHAKIARSG